MLDRSSCPAPLSHPTHPRRRGKCDDALIACTNKNSLFKLQARYIVDRCDAELWDKVLSTENTFRRQLIDQVVSTALPESKNPEQVGGKPQAQAGSGAELNEGGGEFVATSAAQLVV